MEKKTLVTDKNMEENTSQTIQKMEKGRINEPTKRRNLLSNYLHQKTEKNEDRVSSLYIRNNP